MSNNDINAIRDGFSPYNLVADLPASTKVKYDQSEADRKELQNMEYVTVRLSDLDHIVELAIDNGMILEHEDEPIIGRLCAAIEGASKRN